MNSQVILSSIQLNIFNSIVFCIVCYVEESFKKVKCFDKHIAILSKGMEEYIIKYGMHLTAWTHLMFNSISYQNEFVKEKFSPSVLILI